MNADLIKELTVLMDKSKLVGDANDKFRVKAYKDAINKISALNFKITDESQIPLNKTSKLYPKIVDFINNNSIKQATAAKSEYTNLEFYQQLMKIAHIGPVKAKDLINNHNITSLDDLRKNQHLLNNQQIIGLRHFETDQIRIPRQEILKHESYLLQCGNLISPLLTVTISGSFRRGASTSGDIDVLICHPDPNKFTEFVNLLKNNKYLVDDLVFGEKKYMGYSRVNDNDIPRRIDIIYTSPEENAFAILYFTGSDKFNINMRTIASNKGYRLNEKSIIDIKTNESIVLICEKDIFKFLEMEYVEPHLR